MMKMEADSVQMRKGKAVIKVNDGQDPYSVIGKYIREHMTAIEDMIAVIEIDGYITNELFMVDMDADGYFVWKSDWWEGEKNVSLVDFFPVSDAKKPSAQPEQTNSWYINSWCIDCKEYDTENKCCPRYNRVIKQTLDDAYRHGETEAESRFHAQQRWIPCSERLPEEEEQVLIYAWNVHYVLAKYREIRTCDGVYKMAWVTEDAYSTPREIKHEVICWMPLPEPYAERRADETDDIFE